MKSLIIFDLDGTLAKSKSPLDAGMARLLTKLLQAVKVAIISGGAWPQFEKQVLAKLPADAALEHLSILPTSGTRFLRYDGKWTELYAEDFTAAEKKKIIAALHKAFDQSGFTPEKHWGEVIEDRGSQITLSALGQEAPLEAKKTWDPDFAKRKKIKAILNPLIPEFSVGLGGSSSIDITRPGVDKAYGINKLKQELGIPFKAMLFIGVDCIQVRDAEETSRVIQALLACMAG
jgi:HAD superfamily hydrolase (TIGR01484 family)